MKWYKSSLFWLQVASHLSIVPMLMYATAIDYIWSILVFYLFGCWGAAITFHRLVSHKSFNSPQWFKIIGMVFGSLSGVGTSIHWTAVHRKHHRYSDTDKDPHNPRGQFIRMHFLSMLSESSLRYVPDLLRDKQQLWFHKHYWHIHGSYALTLLIIDPFAVIYAYLFPVCLLWHVMSGLGTFAHTERFGYATYDNHARNLPFLGLFAFGEGWHNNHHHRAASAKFGVKWFEFDLSWQIIKLIDRNAKHDLRTTRI